MREFIQQSRASEKALSNPQWWEATQVHTMWLCMFTSMFELSCPHQNIALNANVLHWHSYHVKFSVICLQKVDEKIWLHTKIDYFCFPHFLSICVTPLPPLTFSVRWGRGASLGWQKLAGTRFKGGWGYSPPLFCFFGDFLMLEVLYWL